MTSNREPTPDDNDPSLQIDADQSETFVQAHTASEETTKERPVLPTDMADSETVTYQPSPLVSAVDDFEMTDAQREASGISIGRYQIKSQLGAGAFGIVYQAYDEQLKRDVAIKVPKSNRNNIDPETYLEEARAVAALDAPGIVPVYDVGRTQDGNWFVVSKMIDGCDLDAHIKSGTIDQTEAARIAASIGESLHGAHKKGFAHRDIKPANILISKEGRVYVADFGLAIHETDQDFRAGEVSGTPIYMSPEQVNGKAHHLDGRTDIWSVGIMLYQMLTGRRPFEAQGSLLFEEIRNRVPKPLRMIDDTIPIELENVVLKCLAKDPADRYSTAKDMASDLQSWLQSQSTGVAAEPTLAPVASDPPVDGTTNQVWKILSAALVLAIVAVGFAMSGRDKDSNTPDNENDLSKQQTASNTLNDNKPTNSQDLQPSDATKSDVLTPQVAVDTKADPFVFTATHFRFDEAKNQEVRFGTVKEQRTPIKFEDEIRIDVQLAEPAYFYVLALNPDGVIQPCYPEGDTQPVQSAAIEFPADSTSYFGLTDGRGQQAFVLLVSSEPLPQWSEWLSKHPKFQWSSNDQGGVWEHNGTELKQVFEKTRGVIQKRTSNSLRDFCNFARSQSEFNSIRAIAFHVE
jgi:serine/threonine protein kinase